jgi:ABC-2 type transport system ATP-binding protein
MIKIENLHIQYGSKSVITNLNGTFHEGNVYGIVGLNGAGKTTLFNALNGNKKKSGGHIHFNDLPINKADIAFLETHNYYYSYITGKEYIDLFTTTNKAFILENFQQLFGLPLDELIENYSTGMKKKLALIAMLKKDKPIYLLDEPFNGLDIESNKIVEIIISMLKQKGKIVFISSHIIDPLLKVCDEICLLKDGTFVKQYLKEEFSTLEQDMFGNFGDEARDLLEKSM